MLPVSVFGCVLDDFSILLIFHFWHACLPVDVNFTERGLVNLRLFNLFKLQSFMGLLLVQIIYAIGSVYK